MSRARAGRSYGFNPNPPQYVTFTCEGCGQEQTVTSTVGRSTRGGRRFCGQKCWRKRARQSGFERKVAQVLAALGVQFEPQKRLGRYSVDFGLARQLVIECQGCYWHACEPCGFGQRRATQAPRDARKLAALQEAGYRVLTIWEHEPDIALKLSELLGGEKGG